MSEVNVTLLHGLKIGDEFLKDAVIREPTAADFLEAQEESEKLVYIDQADSGQEPAMVSSPSLFAINVFRRQIVKIGDISGPLPVYMIKKLSLIDFNLLQSKASDLDSLITSKATSRAVAQRGRPESDADAS